MPDQAQSSAAEQALLDEHVAFYGAQQAPLPDGVADDEHEHGDACESCIPGQRGA